MKRKLRHPLRATREPFGKAGLLVAILALILALTGAAFAASGLNGKQKKEVKKIAKQYAGKPGTNGTNGTNGKDGTNGTAGEKGPKGDPGEPGTDGTSVTTTAITAAGLEGHCVGTGGTKVLSASGAEFICNGTNGSTGFTEVLPPEKTETGTWTFGSVAASVPVSARVALSFAIPLEAPLDENHVFYVSLEEQESHTAPSDCPGGAEAPSAEPGYLCIYESSVYEATEAGISQPFGEEEGGAGPTGAVLSFGGLEEFSNASGTFAVTAPEAP